MYHAVNIFFKSEAFADGLNIVAALLLKLIIP
jgi:hypothetical protein